MPCWDAWPTMRECKCRSQFWWRRPSRCLPRCRLANWLLDFRSVPVNRGMSTRRLVENGFRFSSVAESSRQAWFRRPHLSRALVGFLQDLFDVPMAVGITVIVVIVTGIAIRGILESVLVATAITVIEVGGLLWVLAVNAKWFNKSGDRVPEMVPRFCLGRMVWDSGGLVPGVLCLHRFRRYGQRSGRSEESASQFATGNPHCVVDHDSAVCFDRSGGGVGRGSRETGRKSNATGADLSLSKDSRHES